MNLWEWAVILGCGAASVPAGLRWLRIAQREHYLPPAVSRFSVRWWAAGYPNLALAAAAIIAAAAEWWWSGAALVAVAIEGHGPLGLGMRGVTSPLVWTNRLFRVAATTAVLMAAVLAWSAAAGRAGLAAAALVAMPAIVDVALAINLPLERALSNKWVTEAAGRIKRVAPRVVAITGSYGKTSTKLYLAHLLEGRVRVVASPASFNNRLGLARAINERLSPGTEVFIAEMGTYGPGEIAEMCTWIPPEVAVITAIGPVHLERMRTEERILAAKKEILAGDAAAVLGIDHPGLSQLAESESRAGRRVIRCSGAGRRCAVEVDPGSGTVKVEGRPVGEVDLRIHHPLNVAAAVGAVLALGLDPVEVAPRLGTLPSPDHRLATVVNERGITVMDDTFNANPEGARAALGRLVEHSPSGGKRVVVTPGLVEMGPRRRLENRALGEAAAEAGTHLLVVGRTNRRALLEGARGGEARVLVLDNRLQAVRWARANLERGDTILYENDLPDHYP
ncbi:MAG: Mur ligase family protein [bacterium]|nr:Mur ligase family protein [bacterium]MDE0601814.1 Mur ligase family protein [bacterium]